MRTPQGLLPIFLISGLLLGTCLSEQSCVDDACFDQRIQQLKIDRSKIDPASGLKYVERSNDLVATVDVIGVCLPGVNPNVLADTFLSCSNEKMEEVCTMVKRGWLEDKEGKSVVNENAVLATFKELNGGEDAVRECLQIPEVYEYEYYYYDYANYFDEYDYDYLEESASGSRQRRAATGNEAGQKQKNGKGNKPARKGKRGKKGNSSVGKGGKRRTEKRNRKNNRKAKKQNNKKTTKNALRKKERKARKQEKKKARKEAKKEAKKKAKKEAKKAAKKETKKAERKADKKVGNTESAKAEKDARKKALSKLGLKKMPSKSTLEKLTCVQDKITQLLVTCAKNILSKTN